MGYYVSNMIGIRTGGVFAGPTDMDSLKTIIQKVILEMRAEGSTTWSEPDLGDKDGDPSHCMSHELVAHKGSYVVLAGVFNYWGFDSSSEFVKRLSAAVGGAEIMHMCWDEQKNTVQCQIWLAGKPLFEVHEDPIGNIIRRVT